MGRWLNVIIGGLLILVGVVWTLQGLDILGGSVMSGVTVWAIIGPLVIVFGAWVLWRGVRRARP